VDGKNVIIMDDEIATGGSIIELMDRLRERNAQAITVVCTHGVFTGTSFERFQAISEIEEIVTTNTVPFKEENTPDNLTILSIAPLLAETIHRIHSGESVSSLFS
ncbi:uncharacterized protein METZ01_LOCUS271256, partial [marine metagenome]